MYSECIINITIMMYSINWGYLSGNYLLGHCPLLHIQEMLIEDCAAKNIQLITKYIFDVLLKNCN